jgi:hypothetical protein
MKNDIIQSLADFLPTITIEAKNSDRLGSDE